MARIVTERSRARSPVTDSATAGRNGGGTPASTREGDSRLTLPRPGRTLAAPNHVREHPRFGSPMTDSGASVTRPATLGDLRASGWRSRSVKEELRGNLLARLGEGEQIFPGVLG